MKKRLPLKILIIVTIVIFSCENSKDVFPDEINASKTGSLKRIEGTRLFTKTPDTYSFFKNLIRYQKNDNTYFQVIDVPNTAFAEYKSKTTPEAITRQGAKIDVYEPVKFNGFEGTYSEGPSKNEGETKICLAFGDEKFVTVVIGVCLTDDKNSKQELKSIFSSSYYDKLYQLDPLELADFTLDETILGFRYATKIGNIFIYTPDGKIEATKMLETSSYQVMLFDAGGPEKVKEFMEMSTSRLGLQGIEISNIKASDFYINGHPATELSMEAKDKDNNTVTVYQLGIFNTGTTTAVLFIGIDSENGQYFDKFRATAKSLRFRQ